MPHCGRACGALSIFTTNAGRLRSDSLANPVNGAVGMISATVVLVGTVVVEVV